MHRIECMCLFSWAALTPSLLPPSLPAFLSPLQSHQPPWLRFGTLDHIVFIWKYFSCICATRRGERDKGEEGEKHTLLCESQKGLEPCHSSYSLHQLSLIAREDRRPEARLFLILFGAFWGMKSERPAFDLFSSLSLPRSLPLLILFLCHLLLSLPFEWHSLFRPCPLLHPRKIIIKLCFIK